MLLKLPEASFTRCVSTCLASGFTLSFSKVGRDWRETGHRPPEGPGQSGKAVGGGGHPSDPQPIPSPNRTALFPAAFFAALFQLDGKKGLQWVHRYRRYRLSWTQALDQFGDLPGPWGMLHHLVLLGPKLLNRVVMRILLKKRGQSTCAILHIGKGAGCSLQRLTPCLI